MTAVVPDPDVRTYYDRPVLKQPVWKWPIPAYFFAGGLAGASSTLAFAARRRGLRRLSRRASVTSLAAIVASTGFLIEDLGRPERFPNMLRVFRPTSPMSMGSWLLAAFGPATGGAAVSDITGIAPGVGGFLGAVAAALGPAVATYTAVLTADTAVPVWHDARRELPFVYAGSAAASAGAVAVIVAPASEAGPARRLALFGAGLELGAAEAMERNLGSLAEPYRTGSAAPLARLAKALTASGVAIMATSRRRSGRARAGAAMILAGSLATRFAVFRAGFDSAADPRATIGPQRSRSASSLNSSGTRLTSESTTPA